MNSTKKLKIFSPTRADLAGGTLDLWPLHCLLGPCQTINVGLTLGFEVHLESKPESFSVEIEDFTGAKFSFNDVTKPIEIDSLASGLRFPVRIAQEFFRHQSDLPELNIRMTFRSQIPRQSGLGGSSSLCVAITRGLSHLVQDYMEQGWQWRMLRFLKDVEARHLKTATGTQDYLAPLFGGLNSFVSDLGDIQRKAYPKESLEGLRKHFLLVFSGEMHDSGLSNWEIYKKALENDAGMLSGLASIQSIANEVDNELGRQNISWPGLGKLLSEEWEVRKRVFKVHTPRLLEIFDFLNHQPILGAKVCGAAQGGSILILVDSKNREVVKKTLTENKIEVLDAEPCDRMVQVM